MSQEQPVVVWETSEEKSAASPQTGEATVIRKQSLYVISSGFGQQAGTAAPRISQSPTAMAA